MANIFKKAYTYIFNAFLFGIFTDDDDDEGSDEPVEGKIYDSYVIN